MTVVLSQAGHIGADTATEAEEVTLSHRTMESPYGRLMLVATNAGLVRVVFDRENHQTTLAALAERLGARTIETGGPTDEAANQIDDYFAGQRHSFDLILDLQLVDGFRRSVIERIATIPYGSTLSYAALAAEVGNPGAVRAVGSACAHNPLPIVIPCHRVVRSDGTTGNYLGGAEMKSALLAQEAQADQ